MSIYSDYQCGAMDDCEFANARTQMNNAEYEFTGPAIGRDVCTKCGHSIDYHGAFNIDKDHLCWFCFKKQDLKDQRDWEEDDDPTQGDEIRTPWGGSVD